MLKKNIKKIDLIKELKIKLGLSENFSKKILNDFVEIIINNIKEGDFNLKNIGNFKLKKERIWMNPKTKKKYIISARNSISFTTSKNIADHLDKSIWLS